MEAARFHAWRQARAPSAMRSQGYLVAQVKYGKLVIDSIWHLNDLTDKTVAQLCPPAKSSAGAAGAERASCLSWPGWTPCSSFTDS